MPGLTTAAIRSFARLAMPKYIGLGYSSRAIQADLKSRFGRAYRMQTIQADMRAHTGLAKYERFYRQVDKKARVPVSRLIETELTYPANYRIHAKMELSNPFTGLKYTKRVSWFTDVFDSVESTIEDFLNTFLSGRYNDTEVVNSINVVSAEHQRDFPY